MAATPRLDHLVMVSGPTQHRQREGREGPTARNLQEALPRSLPEPSRDTQSSGTNI